MERERGCNILAEPPVALEQWRFVSKKGSDYKDWRYEQRKRTFPRRAVPLNRTPRGTSNNAVETNWLSSTQIALVKRTVLDLYKKYEIPASLSPRRVSEALKTDGLKTAQVCLYGCVVYYTKCTSDFLMNRAGRNQTHSNSRSNKGLAFGLICN